MIERLVASAEANWQRLDGEMAMKNVDPLALPFERYLNLVLVWFLGDRDEAETAKFMAKLWMPPKGAPIPAESPWSPENETKAFAQFKAATTGK